MSRALRRLERAHPTPKFALLRLRNGIQINELFDLAKFPVTLPPSALSTLLFSTLTVVRIEFSNDLVDEFSKHWGEGCG